MYVIAGVSGRTGGRVAQALLQAGPPVRVRVIVRRAEQGTPWRALGAEVSLASLDDEEQLARALDGATGAYLLSPQDMQSVDPISDGWRLADALARALQRGGVGHVVALSALGAQNAEGTGIARTLHALEQRLADVPVPITFLRAACFLETWQMVLGATAAGTLPTFMHPDRARPMVSVRDVGTLAARLLIEGRPAAMRDIVELCGPRDYSPRDLAATLSDLLGRPIQPQAVPLAAVDGIFTNLGATAAFAAQIRLLYEGIEADRLVSQGAGARLVRGTVEPAALFAEALAQGAGS